MPAPGPTRDRAVFVWLVTVFVMILAMVVIGGVTRLTGSGLSMVEWRPLMGTLPPLGEAEWRQVFDRYKEFPQYRQVNEWMTLGDFKHIFFWEYLHRLFGRLIGVAFFVPWLFFTLRGRLKGRLALMTFLAFVFGGLQGLLGWTMVKSGLVDVPAVGHLRLAAHLALALFVSQWVLWIALDLRPPAPGGAPAGIRRGAWALVALVGLTCVYGAFMAGTRAGWLFNTFPTLNGEWIPSAFWTSEPTWSSPFENPVAIHFLHRTLGWLVALAALTWAIIAWRRAQTGRQRLSAGLVAGTVVAQFLLGMLTVLFSVPTPLAAAHQGTACVLLSAAVFAAHTWRAPGTSRGTSDRKLSTSPGKTRNRARASASASARFLRDSGHGQRDWHRPPGLGTSKFARTY